MRQEFNFLLNVVAPNGPALFTSSELTLLEEEAVDDPNGIK